MFKHILLPVDGSELSQKATPAAIEFARTTGAKLTPYIGVEGEASFGVSDDDVVGIPGATAELEHDLAAYVTGTIPVASNLELFGRLARGLRAVACGKLQSVE